MSNILVYVITWAVLHITNKNEEDQIGPADRYKFQVSFNVLGTNKCFSFKRYSQWLLIVFNVKYFILQHIVLVGLGVGVVSSIVFHLGVPEPPASSSSSRLARLAAGSEESLTKKRKMSAKRFLQVPQFYQVALLYMCSRLFANLSQVIIN